MDTVGSHEENEEDDLESGEGSVSSEEEGGRCSGCEDAGEQLLEKLRHEGLR